MPSGRWFVCTLLFVAAPLFAADAVKVSEGGKGAWLQWRGPERAGKSPETGLLQSWEAKKPELVWMAEGMGSGFASVSVANGKVFTVGNKGNGQSVIAVNASDGKIAWEKQITDAKPKHDYEGARSRRLLMATSSMPSAVTAGFTASRRTMGISSGARILPRSGRAI